MKQLAEANWHELPEPEAVRLLEVDPARGLTQAEVGARLRQFGRNEMTAQKRMSEWKRFLLQFAQPLMYSPNAPPSSRASRRSKSSSSCVRCNRAATSSR